jgi:uncharacterized YigZ family protein
MSAYLVPATRYSTESWVRNSHFIATIGPAFSVSDAKNFILEINQQYPDATHNVPAYVIGSGPSTTAHASDDGEPSGTAGKPALSVLMGSKLGDAVLVVTRYYGGTKLGKGGLVKAYTNAAKDAIHGVPKAKKISVHQASIICPYPIYEILLRELKLHQALNLREEFTDKIQIDFSLPVDQLAALRSRVKEISNGQIAIILHKEDLMALQPLKTLEDKLDHV